MVRLKQLKKSGFIVVVSGCPVVVGVGVGVVGVVVGAGLSGDKSMKKMSSWTLVELDDHPPKK